MKTLVDLYPELFDVEVIEGHSLIRRTLLNAQQTPIVYAPLCTFLHHNLEVSEKVLIFAHCIHNRMKSLLYTDGFCK